MEKEKLSCDLRTYDEDTQNGFSSRNNFIPDENLFNLVRVITSLCPKLILSGRLSLHAMGLINIDFEVRKPDLDFSLTEPLEEYELDQIISLLELEKIGGDYETPIEESLYEPIPKTSDLLKKDLIRLFDKKNNIFIDIFNNQYQNDFSPKHENLYPVNFGVYEKTNTPVNHPSPIPMPRLIPHVVYCQHPSVTISHKIKYAFYTDYGKKHKHYNDMIDLMTKHYNDIHKKLNILNAKKKEFIRLIKISQVKDLTTLKHELDYYAYELNRKNGL
jgi:hypothetical protein